MESVSDRRITDVYLSLKDMCINFSEIIIISIIFNKNIMKLTIIIIIIIIIITIIAITIIITITF